MSERASSGLRQLSDSSTRGAQDPFLWPRTALQRGSCHGACGCDSKAVSFSDLEVDMGAHPEQAWWTCLGMLLGEPGFVVSGHLCGTPLPGCSAHVTACHWHLVFFAGSFDSCGECHLLAQISPSSFLVKTCPDDTPVQPGHGHHCSLHWALPSLGPSAQNPALLPPEKSPQRPSLPVPCFLHPAPPSTQTSAPHAPNITNPRCPWWWWGAWHMGPSAM